MVAIIRLGLDGEELANGGVVLFLAMVRSSTNGNIKYSN